MRMALLLPPVLALGPCGPGPARAGQVGIVHDPIPCVPRDRYVRVAARAAGEAALARAEVQFRTGPDAPWYGIAMSPEREGWTALLPRTLPSLSTFEYRVVMTAPRLESFTTPTVAVRVSDSAEGCGAESHDALDRPIIVRIPPGAPVVPPVPPGFNPTGAVAANPPSPAKRTNPAVVAAALGAAGIATAAAALGADSETGPAPLDVPEFMFTGTIPTPGTVLSLSHSSLAVLVTMGREPSHPLDLQWRFELRADDAGPPCLVMQELFNDAQRPLSLALTAPLMATSACGQRFDATVGRLTIQVGDTVVLETMQALPFRVEP